MFRYEENVKSENVVKESWQKDISKDGVPRLAKLIREQSIETVEGIEDAK